MITLPFEVVPGMKEQGRKKNEMILFENIFLDLGSFGSFFL